MAAEHNRNSWNGLAAVIAALVGFLALLVSAYTAYIQRQQTRAQVWPRLLQGVRPADHLFLVYNKGVGPVIVRSVQVFIDGRPQPDWDHVAAQLKLPAVPLYSTIGGVVLSPGEELHLLKFAGQAEFDQAMHYAGRFHMRICYCSVLEDCWALDDRESKNARQIQAVESCAVEPGSEFNQ